LKEGVKKTRDSTLAQLTEQLSQAQAQAAQLADIVERQNKAVESVTRIIQENKQLRETLAQLYAESYAKISAQNQELNAMRADASDMAAMLVQSGLVKPAQENKEQA
jgi:regulator of replication initiation timing